MQVEITAKQLNHFREHRELALEELIDPKTYEAIKNLPIQVDTWRKEEKIFKGISTKIIGQVLVELTGKMPIRILYDKVVEGEKVDLTMLPFQGVLMGLLIPFSGNMATFFAPDKAAKVEERSYLVVYGENNSRFVMRDEVTLYIKEMKDFGYSFGDRLKTKDFPFILK